ncbi:hypothetical protein NM688_g8319 [Phlebia brevispora]|uniref:Uncharacterized protein n=1 Tax=Phlebia brevispora TaxID=194682 RepID=A0ACC1RUU8_9APHY|nr:hypothetical protein NM688_g8319 [Phlebia brevispora]
MYRVVIVGHLLSAISSQSIKLERRQPILSGTAPGTTSIPRQPHLSDNYSTMFQESNLGHILLPLDALRYAEARSQVAFVPSHQVNSEEDGSERRATRLRLKMTLPRPVPMFDELRRSFTVKLTVLGQLSEYDFELETKACVDDEDFDGKGLFRTTMRCWVEERRGRSSRMQWCNARHAMEQLERLVGEPVDMSKFVMIDEPSLSGSMKLHMHGVETHTCLSDTHDFPFYDTDGDRIVLCDASEVPFEVAMHFTFKLRLGCFCLSAPSVSGPLMVQS